MEIVIGDLIMVKHLMTFRIILQAEIIRMLKVLLQQLIVCARMQKENQQ